MSTTPMRAVLASAASSSAVLEASAGGNGTLRNRMDHSTKAGIEYRTRRMREEAASTRNVINMQTPSAFVESVGVSHCAVPSQLLLTYEQYSQSNDGDEAECPVAVEGLCGNGPGSLEQHKYKQDGRLLKAEGKDMAGGLMRVPD